MNIRTAQWAMTPDVPASDSDEFVVEDDHPTGPAMPELPLEADVADVLDQRHDDEAATADED